MTHTVTLRHLGGEIKVVPVVYATERVLYVKWGPLTQDYSIHLFGRGAGILQRCRGFWKLDDLEKGREIMRTIVKSGKAIVQERRFG